MPSDDEQLERIETAYCDANMKCDDDTGLYDVQPGCQARKMAAQAYLVTTGVGLLLDRLAASLAREARLREALALIRNGEGKVCAMYEICTHPSCASSYSAWAIADHALRNDCDERGCSICSDLAAAAAPAAGGQPRDGEEAR